MANGKYNTGSQFDEYFMSAFQFQQEINEKKAQRIQDINFKMRELSLLDDYRQQVLAQDESQFGRTHQLAGEKLTESTRQFDTGLAFDEKKLTEDTRQFDLMLPIRQQNADSDAQANIQYKEEKTPYTKQVELDASEDRLNELKSVKPDSDDDKYYYYDEKGSKSEGIDKAGMDLVIKREEERLKALTDDKARWFNSKWANFDQAYKVFTKSVGEGYITLSNYESQIERSMPNAPTDEVNRMKELIRQRLEIGTDVEGLENQSLLNIYNQ